MKLRPITKFVRILFARETLNNPPILRICGTYPRLGTSEMADAHL